MIDFTLFGFISVQTNLGIYLPSSGLVELLYIRESSWHQSSSFLTSNPIPSPTPSSNENENDSTSSLNKSSRFNQPARYLFLEEAVYWMERGMMEILYDDLPLTLQEAYALLAEHHKTICQHRRHIIATTSQPTASTSSTDRGDSSFLVAPTPVAAIDSLLTQFTDLSLVPTTTLTTLVSSSITPSCSLCCFPSTSSSFSSSPSSPFSCHLCFPFCSCLHFPLSTYRVYCDLKALGYIIWRVEAYHHEKQRQRDKSRIGQELRRIKLKQQAMQVQQEGSEVETETREESGREFETESQHERTKHENEEEDDQEHEAVGQVSDSDSETDSATDAGSPSTLASHFTDPSPASISAMYARLQSLIPHSSIIAPSPDSHSLPVPLPSTPSSSSSSSTDSPSVPPLVALSHLSSSLSSDLFYLWRPSLSSSFSRSRPPLPDSLLLIPNLPLDVDVWSWWSAMGRRVEEEGIRKGVIENVAVRIAVVASHGSRVNYHRVRKFQQ